MKGCRRIRKSAGLAEEKPALQLFDSGGAFGRKRAFICRSVSAGCLGCHTLRKNRQEHKSTNNPRKCVAKKTWPCFVKPEFETLATIWASFSGLADRMATIFTFN